MGRRPEFTGGGLVRSLGGWSQVLFLAGEAMRYFHHAFKRGARLTDCYLHKMTTKKIIIMAIAVVKVHFVIGKRYALPPQIYFSFKIFQSEISEMPRSSAAFNLSPSASSRTLSA